MTKWSYAALECHYFSSFTRDCRFRDSVVFFDIQGPSGVSFLVHHRHYPRFVCSCVDSLMG